jgi:uncharacterized protein YciI
MQRRHLLNLPLAAALAPLGATLAGCATPMDDAAPTVDAQGRLDWFVFLETGRPAPRATEAERAALAQMQRLHLDNFKRLHALKTLFAAGPLADPAGVQRGIVWVKARTREDLPGLFAPDPYVSGGYMTLNAEPVRVKRALRSEGIDPEGIEEVRIVKLLRGSAVPSRALRAERTAMLQRALDEGRFGAWFTPATGPVAEILFARTQDTAAVTAALAAYPGLGRDGVAAQVWRQWIGRGVVPAGAG